MLGTVKNKCIIVIYILAMFFLMFNHSSIDRQLSESVQRMEGTRKSNFNVDAEALGEITENAVLRQELLLPPGVLEIGIRFGTYARENDADYQIILYDNEGNIVAKRVIGAGQIEDNQMCYVTLYGKTSGKVSYVIEISSDNAVVGNAITGYGIQTQEGHNSCTLNGQDTGKELVIELILQKVFPLTLCLMVLLTCGVLVVLLWEKIENCFRKLTYWIGKIWKERKKKIICFNVVLAVVGLVFTFFNKNEEYHLLLGESMDEDGVVCPYSEKLTQNFQSEKDFEALEIRLATYLQNYEQGKLCFSLYEKNGENLLASTEIFAKDIQDNRLLRFEFDKISVEEPTDFYFELYTEDFDGRVLGVYCSEKDGQVQYQLLQKGKFISGEKIMFFILWGILWLLIYLGVCTKIQKRNKQWIVVTVISIFAGLLFSTYTNYNSFSLGALTKNVGLSVKGDLRNYSKKKIDDCTSRIYRYDAKGNVYAVFEQIGMEEVRTEVDTIELYLNKTAYTKKNALAIYLDYGDGFSAKADIEQEYIYRNQEKITVPIKNGNRVERVMISYNMINENGISEEELNNDFHYYSVEKIVLNGEERLWYHAWKSVLFGIFTVWLIFVWVRCKMEGIIGRWLESGKDRMSKVFFIVVLLFGGIFSVLLPLLQAPDEPVHIRWAFQSIGANDIYTQSMEIAEKGVSGIMQNGTIVADKEAYRNVFRRKPASYQFSFQPSMGILNYPGQVCGILLGILLHLPVGWILFLAELFALLLYAILGAKAIGIAPIKKELFMVVLLLPMAIQQAGSFSYDSFNNVMTVLTIAYLLYLSLEKEKVGMKELVIAAGMLFILLWIKKVYAVCGLLLFLIPLEKYAICIFGKKIEFKDKKSKMILVGILVGICCAGGCAMLLILTKNGAITTVLNVFKYPKELGRLFLDTIVVQQNGWIKQGSALFGWLDGIIYDWIIWILLLGLVVASIAGEKKHQKWNQGKYAICIGAFLVCMVGIILSMVSWSAMLQKTTGNFLNQLLLFPAIEGVQGRYFLPVLVLLFLFPPAKWMRKLRKVIPVYLILFTVVLVSAGYSISMLLQRYWIV